LLSSQKELEELLENIKKCAEDLKKQLEEQQEKDTKD